MSRLAILTQIVCLPLLAQNSGVAPAWDVRANLRTLAENTQRYQQTVEQLKVADWVSEGAPDAYQRQQKVVQTEAGYLRTVSAKLADDPERLSLVIDTLYRLEYVESLTGSLADAASRYQDPQAATLSDLLNRNAASRTKLRQYLMELAQTKEHEFSIAHQEAQRCMSMLNQNPLAKPAPAAPKPRTTASSPAGSSSPTVTTPPAAAPVKK
ncbi:MAG: hypothetical protein JNL98_36305 [Bryobacterales bacterium]|nr:hypothetical protein [Bryobacterales bacterium]